MPRFILKIYKLYDRDVDIDVFKFDTDIELLRMFDSYKHFSHVYYIEAGELIYTDTGRTYFRRIWDWIRRK